MYAQECFRQATIDHSLNSPAKSAARIEVPGLERALGPAWWLVASVLVTVVLRLAGVAGEEAIMALAGSASLIYLGTAAIAGRPGAAALDLAAAVVSAGLAMGGGGYPGDGDDGPRVVGSAARLRRTCGPRPALRCGLERLLRCLGPAPGTERLTSRSCGPGLRPGPFSGTAPVSPRRAPRPGLPPRGRST